MNDVLWAETAGMTQIVGMVQITSQFSSVLDFPFSKFTPKSEQIHTTLSQMLLDLKVLLEVGCWGMDQRKVYYAKWVADVIAGLAYESSGGSGPLYYLFDTYKHLLIVHVQSLQ